MGIIKWPFKKDEKQGPRACVMPEKHFTAMQFNGKNQEDIHRWMERIMSEGVEISYYEKRIFMTNHLTGQRGIVEINDYLLYNTPDRELSIISWVKFEHNYKWSDAA